MCYNFIDLVYVENTNETICEISLEFRGELFYEFPWGVQEDFFLPKDLVLNNRTMLLKSFNKLKENGFSPTLWGFEWGSSHIMWDSDKNGFKDKRQ